MDGEPLAPRNSMVQARLTFLRGSRVKDIVSPGWMILPVNALPGVETPDQSLQSYFPALSMIGEGSRFTIFDR